MTIHKKWSQYYFFTLSSLTRSIYPFWSGSLFTRSHNKADKMDIDLIASTLIDATQNQDEVNNIC